MAELEGERDTATRALEEMRTANDRIGYWLSAALEDPSVCAEMKADIGEWFAALSKTEEKG